MVVFLGMVHCAVGKKKGTTRFAKWTQINTDGNKGHGRRATLHDLGDTDARGPRSTDHPYLCGLGAYL
ncbi:MAG: hypothetical protein CME19_25255 [Gemmatimonadetes bacterium]|nr:hypothetical protein [Gemmatimonadota bacterium]